MADLLRVSIFGGMPSNEEWSVNPVYAIGGDFGEAVTNEQAQTIATAIAAIAVPLNVRFMMVPATTVIGCRVEARTLAGVLEAQAEAAKETPEAGTGAVGHSFQTSLVSSLRTGQPGATGRGRLYWPMTGLTVVATTLRVSSSNRLDVLTAVVSYLTAIETAIEATLSGVALSVWSRKNNALYPVTSVSMGDIPDVQRRRRDAALESYASLPY